MLNLEDEEDNVPANVSYHPTAYRDAIMKRIPSGGSMMADVKIHDGLIDVSLRCGQLRWASAQAIAGQTPEQVGLKVEGLFKEWLVRTFANVVKEPKHRRAAVGFKRYLDESPDRQAWLNGEQNKIPDEESP